MFKTQKKQVQQKPYNYFENLKNEMRNAGKSYYCEIGGEGHGGFWPDIPSTLTHLWSITGKDIKPAEEYARFKTLDELSKAAELTKLLDETLNNSKYETVEIPFLNPQGIKKFYEITASKINLSNTQTVCLLLITDITKLKDMDKTIFSTITSTEEKERTRMARELHDGLGALLSSINIYINLVLFQIFHLPNMNLRSYLYRLRNIHQ